MTLLPTRRIHQDRVVGALVPDTQEVINDMLLLVAHIVEPSGTLTEDHHGAQQSWMTQKEMLSSDKLTGIPPHVFNMLEDPDNNRLIELEFTIEEGGF